MPDGESDLMWVLQSGCSIIDCWLRGGRLHSGRSMAWLCALSRISSWKRLLYRRSIQK